MGGLQPPGGLRVLRAGTRVAVPERVIAVLVYAVSLVLAVLVSHLAQRTVLSTAVLFLASGFLVGDGMLGLVVLRPEDPVVWWLVEIALFTVLFTDGMQAGLRDLASAWRLPGRALLLGLPLTLLAVAAFAHWVVGLSWLQALLVGAALSATDPILAAAIVGDRDVPDRLRHLLNVESGLNDGLALPIVLILLAVLGRQEVEPTALLGEAALGVALGVAVPWVVVRMEQTRLLGAASRYEPLLVLAVGLLLFAVASLTHANLFLAAFAAGATLASLSPALREAFHAFGETLGELLKLAALLVFGVLMSPPFLAEIPAGGYLFALLVLFLARPLALAIALFGSRLTWREWVAAAWFGPKGFASVVYGLLILRAPVEGRDQMFHLIALVIVFSIVAHSSTDVLVARWFRREAGPRLRPPALASRLPPRRP
jgi:NhaP-type Na+/H+ or K+/H+ antiporter